MAGRKRKDSEKFIGNGVVPGESDLRATGSWSVPVLCAAVILSVVLVGSMIASGDASAFFGH